MKIFSSLILLTGLMFQLNTFACLDDVLKLIPSRPSNPRVDSAIARVNASKHLKGPQKNDLIKLIKEMEVHPDNMDLINDLVDYSEGLGSGAFFFLKRQIRGGAFKHSPIKAMPFSPLAKFKKVLRNVERYRGKMERKMQKEIDELSSLGALKQTQEAAIRQKYAGRVRFYRDTQMACKKDAASNAFKQASDKFSIRSLPLGLTAPVIAYPMINSMGEKDKRWWSQYGYDLVFIGSQNLIFYRYIMPWIMKRKLGLISSTMVSFGYYNAYNYASIQAIYNPLFGIDEEEARKFLAELDEDDFPEEIVRLLSETAMKESVEKIMDNLANNEEYKELYEYLQSRKFKNLYETIQEEEFKENLVEEQFKDEEISELLFEIIIADIYAQQKGELFDSGGDVGADKFKAEVIVDAISTPVDVAASIFVMQVLCNTLTSKTNMLQALGFYFAWSLTYNAGLFGFRQFGSGF